MNVPNAGGTPDIEAIIRNCVANQAMEGLSCTEEDIAAMRRILTGETTVQAEIAAVAAKHRKKGSGE